MTVFGQNIKLKIQYTENDSLELITDEFESKKALISYLDAKKIAAFSEGNLAFSIDSLEFVDSVNYKAYIHVGSKYYWGDIKWSLKEGVLLKSGLSTKKISHFDASPNRMTSFYKTLINYCENNGYPFAVVKLDSVTIKNDSISGSLQVVEGQLFTYDTLSLHGDLQLNKKYLEQYLGLVEGEVYKEKKFVEIAKRIKELPFVAQFQKPTVEFQNGKAVVHLYLNRKSANFFNGVIGVLPNSPQLEQINTGSNLLLTGDVKLILVNQLRSGEKIDFSWKRLKPETQQLNAGLSFPYLINTPFGLDDNLELLKQDSSFINFSNQLGVIYSLSSEKQIKVFWEHKSTKVLDKGEANSELLGNKSNSYGLELLLEQLDYRFNPTKGVKIMLLAQAGIRTLNGVEEGDKIIIDLPFNNENVTALALIPKNSPLYKFKLEMEYYIPLFKITTIKLASKNSYIYNPYLFNNDLDRIGGFKLLRGFDEQSIFTSFSSVFTFEYRLLLEQNSFIGLFYDHAYIQTNTFLDQSSDFPLGFGASISFQTKPGIFSIMYALGRQRGNSVNFSSAKIHFGFVSLF